jgi:catechol 2,3-dioxygenase-like lactoylglutathione lyase family enzyme
MAAFQVKGLDHVVLRIADRERALAFYIGILGLRIEKEVASIGLIQLRAGAALVDLVEIGAGPAPSGAPNMDHFCLAITPFDETALRAHLSGHGVEVVDSGSRYGAEGEGPSLYVRDPDGNTLELKGPASAPARPA